MFDEIKYVWCDTCRDNFPMRRAKCESFEESGNTFYCPNGHSLTILRKTIVSQMRSSDRIAERHKNRANRLAKTVSSLRGVQARYRNRLLRGDCPYCGKCNVGSDLVGHICAHHAPNMKKRKV